jgi:hypothetical protein
MELPEIDIFGFILNREKQRIRHKFELYNTLFRIYVVMRHISEIARNIV